jgi:serine/threonine-protein kinase
MSQDPRPLVGGKYQVIEAIKTGGTALIELAIMRGENNFSREVVLKRPLPHLLADRSLRAMFLDEAHLASRLAHPNVVQVIDLVARDDEIFLVLEYLRGRDLREVIKRGTERGRVVPPDIAAYITAEAAAGLGYAHDATTPDGVPLGLVHRDVSPKNLRITDNGAVKVIDFGIARAEFRQTETAPGSVKGTLGYMSPEQVLGEAVDRRSDIFSLGICLFQMLTGRNPFDGGTLRERVSKLIQEPIPHVRELVPDVDARLEAIVERALERDLDRRYPRMEALGRDLEAYLADLRLASPRQRLVAHLESLFPDLHQLPPRLQEALSNSSSLSARGGAALLDAAREAHANAATAQVSPAQVSRAMDADTPSAATGPSAYSSWSEPPAIVGAADSAAPKGPGASERATLTDTAAARRGPPLWVAAAGAVAVLVAVALWIQTDRATVVQLPEAGRDAEAPAPSTLVPSVAATAASPAASVATSTRSAGGTTSTSAVVVAPTAAPIATPRPSLSPGDVPPGASVSPGRAPASGKPGRGAHTPRELLRAGAYLARLGQLEDAELLYRVAYGRSEGRVDPAIYKNLGLLHRDRGEVDKLRACFNMYLSKRPAGADAARVRALLAGFPAAPSVPCVSEGEAREAEVVARRAGARVDGWVAAAADGE